MSEVPREADSLYEAFLMRILTYEWPSVVFAAVVDQHDLKRARVSFD
jgi:hypothetical protein